MLDRGDLDQISAMIDQRLKSSRHEAADHLDRGLLLQKLAASGAVDGSVPVWDAATQLWTATSQAGAGRIATGSFSMGVVSTGNDHTVTTGFRPRLIRFTGTHDTATSTFAIASIGTWDVVANTEWATGFNAATGSGAASVITSNSVCGILIASAGTVAAQLGKNSVTDTSFTVTIDNDYPNGDWRWEAFG